jgi:hypothetical protein
MKRGRAEPRAAKRARAAESERRARMFVHAHLAWLVGFAEATDAGLRWHRLDGSAPFLVDRALIARARRAQKTLVSDHADALETVVGDVAHWGAAVDGALTAIGHALRDGGVPAPPIAILPPRARKLVASVRSAYPALVEVVDAAAIAMLGRPEDLVDALAWVGTHGEALAELVVAEPGVRGLLAVLRLARFADEDGAEAVAPLVTLVCLDAPLPGPALEFARAIAGRLRSGGNARPMPPKTTTSTVVDWIARLATVDPAARKRVLALVALVDLATPLTSARRWWKRAWPQLQRAQAVADGATLDIEYVKSNLEAVDALVKAGPLVFEPLGCIGTIEQAAWPGVAPYFPSLVRLPRSCRCASARWRGCGSSTSCATTPRSPANASSPGCGARSPARSRAARRRSACWRRGARRSKAAEGVTRSRSATPSSRRPTPGAWPPSWRRARGMPRSRTPSSIARWRSCAPRSRPTWSPR